MAPSVSSKEGNNTVYPPIGYHPHSLPGLPSDMVLAILSRMSSKELRVLSLVSRDFAVLSSDNGLWKHLFGERFSYLPILNIPESYKALYEGALAVRTGQLHTITLENQENVTCAKICGEFICTGSTNGIIIVLDQTTGETLCTISSEIGYVLCIDMSMASSILCAGGTHGVQAWRVDTQEGLSHPIFFSDSDQQNNPHVRQIEGWIKIHEDRWLCAGLCAAGFGGDLSIWDLANQKKLPIDPELGILDCVRFFENGIVCTARSMRVALRDLKTGRCIQQFNFEDAIVKMMICNNKFLFVTHDTIFVKDVLTGDYLPSIKIPPPTNPSLLITCIDIEGDTLCVGWTNGWLSVHNLETGELLYVFCKGKNILKDFLNGTASGDFSHSWRRVKMIHHAILVSQCSGSVCFWDLATGQQLREECMPANHFIELFDIQDDTFLTRDLLSSKMMISRFK
jgi:hypothetical protein